MPDSPLTEAEELLWRMRQMMRLMSNQIEAYLEAKPGEIGKLEDDEPDPDLDAGVPKG
jgi:hypothetical protein